MRVVTALTIGFVLWVVVWAFTDKGFDALLVFIAILVLACTAEIASRYLPSRD